MCVVSYLFHARVLSCLLHVTSVYAHVLASATARAVFIVNVCVCFAAWFAALWLCARTCARTVHISCGMLAWVPVFVLVWPCSSFSLSVAAVLFWMLVFFAVVFFGTLVGVSVTVIGSVP